MNGPALDVRPAPGGGVRLAVRVVPRASTNGLGGVRDGRLVVRVTAPPVDRAANDAVTRLLAGTFSVPRGGVRIVTGAAGRQKIVQIDGVTAADVQRVVSGLAGTAGPSASLPADD